MIRYNQLYPDILPFPEIQVAILHFTHNLSITEEQLNYPLLVLNLIYESLATFSQRTLYNHIAVKIDVRSRRIVNLHMKRFFMWLDRDDKTLQDFQYRIDDSYRREIYRLHDPTCEEKKGSLLGIHHILTNLLSARDTRITQLQQSYPLAYIAMISYFNLVMSFRDYSIEDIISELDISAQEYESLIRQALEVLDLKYDGDLRITNN